MSRSAIQVASSGEASPRDSPAAPGRAGLFRPPLVRAPTPDFLNSSGSGVPTCGSGPPPATASKFTVWLHQSDARGSAPVYRNAPVDLLFNPSHFPRAVDGDVFELSGSAEGDPKATFQIVVSGSKCDEKEAKTRMQLTLLEGLARRFGIANRSSVSVKVHKVRAVPAPYHLDSVELHFKDTYLSRSDAWRLSRAMQDRAVYIGAGFELDKARAAVRTLYSVGGQHVKSGVVSELTKVIFRSRSATMYWLWQMSREMWSYTSEGELYFDVAVNSFLSEYIQRWEAADLSHCICVIFFCRVVYPSGKPAGLRRAPPGTSYHDYYKVVKVINEKKDIEKARQVLKRNFISFASSLGCGCLFDLPSSTEAPSGLEGHPRGPPLEQFSTAKDGNLLECVNMALNDFERHYVDRTLTHAGQSIMVLTAGRG
eukprot:RCo009643